MGAFRQAAGSQRRPTSEPPLPSGSRVACYNITQPRKRAFVAESLNAKLAARRGFETPDGPVPTHRDDEPGHLRSAFAASQREAERVEQLAPFLSGRALHFLGQRAPRLGAPVEFLGGGGGVLDQQA